MKTALNIIKILSVTITLLAALTLILSWNTKPLIIHEYLGHPHW